jgi:hypothetical protein
VLQLPALLRNVIVSGMNATPDPLDQPARNEPGLSAVEKAIRERALDSIAQEAARPPTSMRRRLLILVLVLASSAGFLISVNFVVTGMRKIMDIWYPGSITGRVQQTPEPLPGTAGSDRPFVITVVPPSSNTTSSGQQSSATR